MNLHAIERAPESANSERRWGRVREIREAYGFSKPWIFAALKDGRIRGKKVGGVLLVDLDTVRELVERSPDWTP